MNVIAAGDCGVDRYLNLGVDRAGGISLNFAVNARLLFPDDARIGVVTALGDDPEAQVVRAVFEQYAIDAIAPEIPGATPIQYIDREPSGEKIFVRYEAGMLGGHRLDPAGRAAIDKSDLMMTALYKDVSGFIDSVMDSPSRGLRVCDFGALVGFENPLCLIRRYIDRLDLGFFGLSIHDHELIQAIQTIADQSQCLFIITLAANGGLAMQGSQRFQFEAMPVGEVVDSTGAGDTFAAGFLSNYAYSRNIERSLDSGARAAASTLTQVGAFEAPSIPSPKSTGMAKPLQ